MNQINEMKQSLMELFIELQSVVQLPSPQKEMQMLRLAIVAEYDAANLYENMAHFCTNENVKEVLLDIAQEEKVHIGELETLLSEIDDEHDDSMEEGEEEVEKETGDME